MRGRCPAAALLGLLILASLACEAPPVVSTVPHGPLESFFVEDADFVLQEQAEDSIAGPGAFLESANGDFYLADRLLPRVRKYSSHGALISSAGRFGDGPFEFRRVVGLWEEDVERLWVANSGATRISVFTGSLDPKEEFPVPVRPMGLLGGAALPTLMGLRIDDMTSNPVVSGGAHLRFLHPVSVDGELRRSFWRPPDAVHEEPYWGSVMRVLAAAVGEDIAVATSILYPIDVLRKDGKQYAALDSPPPSFRTLAPVERGAFSAGVGTPGFTEWLEEATVISKLVPVRTDMLVVAHARLGSEMDQAISTTEYAFDVWDLTNRRKIGEDVPLPVGTSILGGGRFLYLIEEGPPWRVRRFRARP